MGASLLLACAACGAPEVSEEFNSRGNAYQTLEVQTSLSGTVTVTTATVDVNANTCEEVHFNQDTFDCVLQGIAHGQDDPLVGRAWYGFEVTGSNCRDDSKYNLLRQLTRTGIAEQGWYDFGWDVSGEVMQRTGRSLRIDKTVGNAPECNDDNDERTSASQGQQQGTAYEFDLRGSISEI